MVSARNAGLQPQELALTIAGAHVREPGTLVWSGGFVALLREFGFSTEASRAALARLVQRGLLAREMAGRRALYTLTPKALAVLDRGDRRIFSFARSESPERVWTALWHTIPQGLRAERARFATGLRFLGFGSVQDATWVAAHDREAEVLELASELDIQPYLAILIGRTSERLQTGVLVAEAWDLAGVADRYEQFLADYGELRRAGARRALTPTEAFVTRTLMLHQFRAFPFLDPELPGPAAGVTRLRQRMVALFDLVYGSLEDAAAEHFRAVAQPAFAVRA
ncbi:MAG TPA: PaaX family transcriptional regulator C-terminal domain-containing protein [Baekduia sp.]|nr:PaaX family transcriptional regulator C-terminal domain-containing protein [Baekduia sp.]